MRDITAVEVRWLTEQALKRREIQKQGEAADAEVTRIKSAEDARQLWLTHGVFQVLNGVKKAAQRGIRFYEERRGVCPDYVVESLRNRGFEVVVRDSAWHAPILTIRW